MNDALISGLVILIYAFFSIRWGYRFVDGRWAWLESPDRKVLKFLVALFLGYFLAGLYFVFWCLKMILIVIPRWLS